MIYLGKSNGKIFYHFAPDDLAAVGAYRHNFLHAFLIFFFFFPAQCCAAFSFTFNSRATAATLSLQL